jgi:inhibitor of cysteine peptidase
MHAGRLGTFVLLLLLLLGALVGGCAATASPQPAAPRDVLTVTCDEFAAQSGGTTSEPLSRNVTVVPGESFRITLCSNASTGFSWEDPAIAGPANVSLVDHQTVPAATAMPGAPGTESFTFRAASAGTATIDFAYSRPWEGGEKGAWQVTVSVDSK